MASGQWVAVVIIVGVEWSIVTEPFPHGFNEIFNIDSSFTATGYLVDGAGVVDSSRIDGRYVLTDVGKRGQIVTMRVVVEGALLGVV